MHRIDVEVQAKMIKRGPYWESSVLKSGAHVVANATLIKVNEDKISEVADWMAYEEFAKPMGGTLFDFGADPDDLMDFIFVVNSLNFAFTDFKTGVKFETDYQGRTWCDSEAMLACMHRATTVGIPFFDGDYLATVTREQLAEVFSGSIEMPLLDERIEILNKVGKTLSEKYAGRYANFIRDCDPKLYSNGNGLLERLVREFPRFDDVSTYKGQRVEIFKLAQLGIWSLHMTLSPVNLWRLEDAQMLTAFADYIVPVGLRVMGIFAYVPELEERINKLEMIERDTDAEIEIRALSLYALARLTDEINHRRPGLDPLLVPQVDYRLWKTYHATHWPHHLTETVMY